MAIKTHKVGKVSIDTDTLGECDNATLAITFDIGETTELGDTWKEQLALGKSWNLSVSAKYNPEDQAQIDMRTQLISGTGVIADLRMYEDDTWYFKGAAVITSYNITKAVNAIDVLSMTFEGSGLLAYTNA